MTHDDDLAALRTAARAARRAIGDDRAQLDLARHERLTRSGLLDGATTIAAYIADDGEADPLPWRHATEGRQVAFPVVADDSEVARFFVASGPDEMREGRWGIPVPPSDHELALADIDVVLVPLVVFDRTGARAGRGRGFYDRTLAPIDRTRPHSERPTLIGIAHDVQQVERVPQHAHDVPLDAVATATRILDCS